MEDGNDKSDTPTRLVERVHMQNKVDILDFSVQDHPLCILTAVLSASGRVILRAEKECSRTYLSLRLPVDSDSAFNQDADLNQANNISGSQYQRILIVSVVPLKIAVLQAAATLVLLDLRQYFVTSGLFAGTLPGKDISTLNSSKVKGFTDRKNTDKRGSFKAKLSLFELSDDSKREISADLSIEETINSISGLIEVIYSTETSLVSEGLEVQDIFYVGSNEKSVGGSQLLLKCGSSRFACIGLPESQSTDHNYHHFPEKQILSVDNPTGSNICVTNLSFFLLPKLLREEFGVLVWGVSDNGMTFVCPVDTSVTQVGQTEDNEYSNSKISEDFDASIWRDCGDEEEIATNTSNTIQKGKTRIRSVTGLKFSRDEVTILRPFSKTSDTSRSIIDCSDQLACFSFLSVLEQFAAKMNMNHNSGRVCTMHDVEAVQRMVSFYRMLSESNLTVVLKQLTAKEENFMLCCYAEWTRGGESLHWNLKLLVFAVPIQLLKNVNRINPGVRNNDTLKSLERVRHCCTIDLSENIKALTGLDIKGVSISLLRLGLTLSIYSPLHLSKKSYPLIFHYSNIHKRWTSCNDEKETEPHPDFEVHSLVWSSAVSIGEWLSSRQTAVVFQSSPNRLTRLLSTRKVKFSTTFFASALSLYKVTITESQDIRIGGNGRTRTTLYQPSIHDFALSFLKSFRSTSDIELNLRIDGIPADSLNYTKLSHDLLFSPSKFLRNYTSTKYPTQAITYTNCFDLLNDEVQVSNLKPCVCPNEAIRIGGEALLTWIQVVGFIVSGKVSQRGNSISLLELVDIIHVCHQIRKRALHFYSKLVCPLLSIVQAMSDFACFITAAKLMQMVGEIVLNSQKCLNPVVATNDTNMLMLAKLKCVALLLVKPIRVRNESDIDKQVCAIRNSLLLIKDGYSAENSHHFSVMLYTLRRLLTQISTDLDSFKHEAYFEEGIETLAGIMIDSNNIVVAELLVHKYKWLSKEGKFTRLQQTYWRSSIYNSHKISSYQAKDLELDRTKENTMQCMAAAMTEATTSLLYSDSVTWDDQYKDLQLFILQLLEKVIELRLKTTVLETSVVALWSDKVDVAKVLSQALLSLLIANTKLNTIFSAKFVRTVLIQNLSK